MERLNDIDRHMVHMTHEILTDRRTDRQAES